MKPTIEIWATIARIYDVPTLFMQRLNGSLHPLLWKTGDKIRQPYSLHENFDYTMPTLTKELFESTIDTITIGERKALIQAFQDWHNGSALFNILINPQPFVDFIKHGEHPTNLTELVKLNKVEVWQDLDPEDPFEYLEDVYFIHDNRDVVDVGNKIYKSEPIEWMFEQCKYNKWGTWDDMQDALGRNEAEAQVTKRFSKGHIWMPVYTIEHGSTAYSTTPFSCGGGECGFVCMEKGLMRYSRSHAKLLAKLASGIDLYNTWQSGGVMGVTYGDDSCGGFHDYDAMAIMLTHSINLPVKVIKSHLEAIDIKY